MKSNIQIGRTIAFFVIILLLSDHIKAEGSNDNLQKNKTDTLPTLSRLIHRIGIEGRPAYIFPTNTFFKGENEAGKPIKKAFSAHLKYSFQSQSGSCPDRIYGGSYQGVGIAYYSLGNRQELGNPLAFYLFQGARIARFAPWLSFNYEWNFGLSTGWKPYDYEKNYYNKAIGSKANAYLNTNFYLNWTLNQRLDLTSGLTLAHFSNGNTKFPNAGLNTIGLKVGLIYYVNRENEAVRAIDQQPVPTYPRHVSYDLVLFGSWRRKGVVFGDKQIPSPHAYPVLGFNFAPMYNLGYRFRVGASLDGVYDGSANVYAREHIGDTEHDFYKPSLNKQLALGLSGRIEYVMPYFTVGTGFGYTILHGGGDLKAFYQILALKIALTRSSFIHIGYNIKDFHEPNFLMLGVGFRFNNSYPTFH